MPTKPVSVATSVSHQPKTRLREEFQFYLFISPWLLGLMIFTIGPMVASIGLSLTRYDVITPPVFIGPENFRVAFTTDPLFWKSLRVTAVYVLGAVPLRMVAALIVALLMNQKIRGMAIFRTVYYLPAIISGVPVALLWQAILNPAGLLNGLLSKIGIHGPNWLFSETWVLPAFWIMSLWGIGGSMVIYLAALQGIPQQLYEAAELDGANALGKLWNVTLPMISPVIFFNLVMNLIGSFQTFAASYLMTGGGPNNASRLYMLHLYANAFSYFKMGYASALAWILFIIIMAFSLLVVRSSSAWVYYEGMIGGPKK